MKKQLVFGVMVLAFRGMALACEPGTAEFEDAFYKYCDDARARAQEAPAIVPAATRATGGAGEGSPPMHEEKRLERAMTEKARFPEEAMAASREIP